ncbi:PAS domain-containing protein [Candidatus Sumerlaeota bacterium]|nr:PAS domain-containing protein [Candidatus Sumerlaeota bacterium]
MEQPWVYLTLLGASFLISIGVGIYSNRHASSSVAHLFTAMTVFEALWTFGYAGELLSASLSGKIFWDNAQWIPTLGIPAALIAFSLRYAGLRLRRENFVWAVLGGISLLILLAAFADPWLGLMRHNPRLAPGDGFSELLYEFTPLHNLINLFIMGEAIAGLGILLGYLLRAPQLYRRQALIIFIGAVSPFVAAIMAIAGIDFGMPQRDMLPFAFIPLNLCIAWGLFSVRLFDIVPLARETIIETLSDPVAVLDAEDRILDVNPALLKLTGGRANDLIGSRAD